MKSVTHSYLKRLKSWNEAIFAMLCCAMLHSMLRWCSSAKHLGLSSPRPGFKSPAEHSYHSGTHLTS